MIAEKTIFQKYWVVDDSGVIHCINLGGVDDQDIETQKIDRGIPESSQPSDTCPPELESAYAKQCDNEEAMENRRQSYPRVGDQLDAIWKTFDTHRAKASQLKTELDGMEIDQTVKDFLGKIIDAYGNLSDDANNILARLTVSRRSIN